MENWKYLKPLGYAGPLCVICYVAQEPEEVGTQTLTAVGLRAIPYLAFGRGFILLHKSSVNFTYSGLLAVNINVHQLQNKLHLGLTAGNGFVSRCAVDAYLG
jgi:hypothetical protein